MPILIRYIQGQVDTPIIGNTRLPQSIIARIGFEDYINLYNYIAYLQNLTQAQNTFALVTPASFGFKSLTQPNNTGNNTIVTLQINY